MEAPDCLNTSSNSSNLYVYYSFYFLYKDI